MRTKRIAISTLAEVIPYIVIGLLGIIKVRVLITNLGDILNGYYQFINNTISYLFMAEAGFGAAVIYYLYKYFAEEDKEGIKRIYLGARKIFRFLGLIILGLISIVGIVLPIFFIPDNQYDLVVTLSFIVISVSYLFSFFGPSKSYRAVFCADQKKYLFSIIFNTLKIISDLLIIIVITLTKELMWIAVVIFIVKLIEELIIYYVGRKKYPYLKDAKEADTEPFAMTKDLVWHQFGYLAAHNIDAIILMIINGPFVVSIYTTYNFILRFLKEIAGKIDNVVVHSFGNVYVKENKEKAFKLFKEYSDFCVFLAYSISLTFLIGIRPFVLFWIGDISYLLSSKIIVFFSFNLFLMIIYLPLVSSISSNGLYKESKYYILAGALVNLILSIILVNIYGIGGVLLATAISYLFIIVLRARLIRREIFPTIKLRRFIGSYFINSGIFIAVAILFMQIEEKMMLIDNLFYLLIILGISYVVISILTVGIMILKGTSILNTLNRIKRIIKKA